MSQQLRMLVLASTLQVGGGEMVLSRLLSQAAARNIQPTLLLLKKPGTVGEQLALGGIPVRSLELGNTRRPGILFALLKTFRDLEPDLLYIQDHHDCLFWGRLGAAISGFRATVSPVHSSAQGALRAFHWYNKPLLGLSPNLCTLGSWQERGLVEREKIPRGFWVQVPNPVDLKNTIPVDPRPVWTPGTRPLILGTVAALRPEKRHHMMLELVAHLSRRIPVELRLVGDGPLRGTLATRSRELGIEDRVRFLGQQDDVEGELAGMDIFILTSSEEALPMSVLEAMGAGIPVVAPPHGAIPDLLARGERGLLLEGDDPVGWSRQILAYLQRLPSRVELREWSDSIREQYSVENFLAGYSRLLYYLGGS